MAILASFTLDRSQAPEEPEDMTRKLKRIAPVKFGMILGIIYGLFSLVIIPFVLLGFVAAAFAPAQGNAMAQGIGAGIGLIFCIFLPVLYAAMGCLLGMLMAWLYNVVAGWIGGIEFEVE
jgi:hypothetical protein